MHLFSNTAFFTWKNFLYLFNNFLYFFSYLFYQFTIAEECKLFNGICFGCQTIVSIHTKIPTTPIYQNINHTHPPTKISPKKNVGYSSICFLIFESFYLVYRTWNIYAWVWKKRVETRSIEHELERKTRNEYVGKI